MIREGSLAAAVQALTDYLAHHDGDAQAHLLLADALTKQGDLTAAIDHATMAATQNPGNARVHGLRGMLLLRNGEQVAALAAFRKASDVSPNDPGAWANLGAACMRLRRTTAAIAAFETAVELAPGQALARAQLADANLIAGNFQAAVAHYEAVVRHTPGDIAFRLGLANAHRAGGDLGKAVEVLETAIRELGDNARVQALLGDLKVALGDFPSACAHYNASLAIDPGNVNALSGLSRLERPESKSELAARIGARLTEPGLSEEERIVLLFARGNLLDRVGEHEAAMTYFQNGNRRKHAVTPYSLEANAASVARLKRAFSTEVMASAEVASTVKNQGEAADMPIFILGMPRSGTTLVERILGAHPQVHAAGELIYLMRIIQDWPELIGDAPGYEAQGYPDGIASLGPADRARLGRRYLDKVCALAGGKPRITDKNPFNFEHLGLISLILPGAKVVHCTRDAMDLCTSNYVTLYQGNQGAFSYDLADVAGYYRLYRELMDHWRAVTRLDVMELSYEALIEDQEAESRRLLAFCGLPWDEGVLAFEQQGGAVQTASSIQVRQPITRSSLGRWRRYGVALEPLKQALRPNYRSSAD